MPPVADQVTAVFVLPVTLAMNCWLPPVNNDAEVGVIETATAVVAESTPVPKPDSVHTAQTVPVDQAGGSEVNVVELLPSLLHPFPESRKYGCPLPTPNKAIQ